MKERPHRLFHSIDSAIRRCILATAILPLPCANSIAAIQTPGQRRAIEEHLRKNREAIERGEERVRQERLQQYLTKFEDSGDATWIYAIRELALPSDQGVTLLVRLLGRPDAQVKAASLAALGDYGPAGAAALDDVVACFVESDDWLAADAAAVLGGMGESAAARALPPLLDRLRSDEKSLLVRRAVLKALGRFGPLAREALPAVKRFVTDADSNTAYEAWLAAGAIRAEPALPVAAFNGADGTIFLGDRGFSSFASLKSGLVSPERARDLLCDLLRRRPPAAERVFAIEMLGTLSPSEPHCADELLKAAGSLDEFVSNAALASLRSFTSSDTRSLKFLAEALGSKDSRVAIAAAGVAARFGPKADRCATAAAKALRECRGHADYVRVGALLELLSAIGPAAGESVPVLNDMLRIEARVYNGMSDSQIADVRSFVLVTLARVAITQDAIGAIIELLDHGDARQFAAAAMAAAALPKSDERLVPHLLRPLQADFHDSVVSLHRFGHPFLTAPASHNTCTRLEAIRALIRIGPPAAKAALPLLKQCAADPKEMPGLPETCQAAAERAIQTLSK